MQEACRGSNFSTDSPARVFELSVPPMFLPAFAAIADAPAASWLSRLRPLRTLQSSRSPPSCSHYGDDAFRPLHRATRPPRALASSHEHGAKTLPSSAPRLRAFQAKRAGSVCSWRENAPKWFDCKWNFASYAASSARSGQLLNSVPANKFPTAIKY